jgi:hypothetical protein
VADDGAGVEHNPKNMKPAVLLLEKAGYQTLQAEDATEGMRLARQWRPNLILIPLAGAALPCCCCKATGSLETAPQNGGSIDLLAINWNSWD